MWFYCIGLILLCGQVKCKTIVILCFYNIVFSLMLLQSPNVADFNNYSNYSYHHTNKHWASLVWSALLKDMKYITQSVAHDQARV